MDKENYICSAPFNYTEVFDNEQYLCCPSWLPVNVWDGKSIKSSFHSKKAKEVRESILDGSYKYCDSKQCPALAGLLNNKPNKKFIPKNKKTEEYFRNKQDIGRVNFCFDSSCNFQCPSCRLELINYKGIQRQQVEKKLIEVNDELSKEVEFLYLSGTADPFYSKSFRLFLENIDKNKFSKLKNIHLHTNASLWNKSMWLKLKKAHKFIKSCEISIDAATKNTYENVTRIGGNWDTLLNNLSFIVKIPSIEEYRFSFVVQNENFREMRSFYELIESFMKNTDKRYSIFFNSIVNWGTFTEQEYKNINVTDPTHFNHKEFIKEVHNIKDLPFIDNNFQHLYIRKQSLI